METIIKVSPSELDIKLLNKIRDFIGNKRNVDVTKFLKEIDATYMESLDHSIQQADDDGSLISFTMEDFMAYTPKKEA